MDVETVKAKMLQQVEDIQRIEAAFGWSITVEGLDCFIEMKCRRGESNSFLLRVSFDDYDQRPPSYVFVDEQRRQLGNWPPGVQHGHATPGICTPGTRECIEIYHKNDAHGKWSPSIYPVRSVVMEIQRIMERG